MADLFRGRQLYSGAILFAFTVAGLLFSLGISRVPAADPAKSSTHFLSLTCGSPMKLIRGDRVLSLASWATRISSSWLALLQFNIFLYGQDVLHLDSTRGGLLQGAVAIGIGIGSLAAGFLSGGKIEYGLIPLGALGITVGGLCLALPGLSFLAVALLLAALGFAGGFFIVPISALIQHIPAEEHQRRSARRGELAFVRWRWSSVRRILFGGPLGALEPWRDFSLVRP